MINEVWPRANLAVVTNNSTVIIGVILIDFVLILYIITPTGIEVISASVQNVLACIYIAPIGIEVVSMSVHKIPVGKIIAPTCIEIVSVVVQITPASAPQVTNMIFLVPLHGSEIVTLIYMDLYSIKIVYFNLLFILKDSVINLLCS